MKAAEKAEVTASVTTLGRVRRIRVKFMAAWTRLDDLEPEDERSLTAALQSAWDTWAVAHGIEAPQVKGPEVITHKLDYVPSIDGEIPG